jgi:hypothetical protein
VAGAISWGGSTDICAGYKIGCREWGRIQVHCGVYIGGWTHARVFIGKQEEDRQIYEAEDEKTRIATIWLGRTTVDKVLDGSSTLFGSRQRQTYTTEHDHCSPLWLVKYHVDA